ncbi:DNA repair protein RadA [Candidatus Magnetobacterium casense]|uniref:DNA repair protein RadA n=1 Tax=Candidatus Magnetobacterium casense TaxID=1455061 RepID=A0ABS6RZX6_9BACT|nr:DNA repair protein RadA [Candidatus Magnetobacterium casensis]MBV6342164.1 DNA repair protein RadA [Candidatus Magnetobacterium casensis]
MNPPKDKTVFQCQSCGRQSLKWVGKCPDCGAWNSFVEERQEKSEKPRTSRPSLKSTPTSIADIELADEERISTGIQELNRVLGGGIVAGSLILIGGDPGIGKSTLVLQLLEGVYKNNSSVGGVALYVSAEESLKQIKLRAKRLGIDTAEILIVSETSLEVIFEHIKKIKPVVVIIDSIQTVFTQELNSVPGSVGQVREAAMRLMLYAKQSSVPVFIVGHVTKEGAIAGPRTLEHIVDTVIYFEGDRGHPYRILRAVKNRFGSTNEIGVFEMREGGLAEVTNPSELFLAERPMGVAGTTVISTMEGTRPLLVELQALVTQTTFGVARRTGIGVDVNRVNLLVAVLEKIGGLHLGHMDIFLNVVGGLRISEPAFDLGIVTTIASSFLDRPVEESIFVFGEVGLSGEIRAVSQAEARIKEGAKIGFKQAILPEANLTRLSITPQIQLRGVKNIDEALKIAINR